MIALTGKGSKEIDQGSSLFVNVETVAFLFTRGGDALGQDGVGRVCQILGHGNQPDGNASLPGRCSELGWRAMGHSFGAKPKDGHPLFDPVCLRIQSRGGSPWARGKYAPKIQDGWMPEDRLSSKGNIRFGCPCSFAHEEHVCSHCIRVRVVGWELKACLPCMHAFAADRSTIPVDKSSTLKFSGVADGHVGGEAHEAFKYGAASALPR